MLGSLRNHLQVYHLLHFKGIKELFMLAFYLLTVWSSIRTQFSTFTIFTRRNLTIICKVGIECLSPLDGGVMDSSFFIFQQLLELIKTIICSSFFKLTAHKKLSNSLSRLQCLPCTRCCLALPEFWHILEYGILNRLTSPCYRNGC
jgi:hypothetical protein